MSSKYTKWQISSRWGDVRKFSMSMPTKLVDAMEAVIDHRDGERRYGRSSRSQIITEMALRGLEQYAEEMAEAGTPLVAGDGEMIIPPVGGT